MISYLMVLGQPGGEIVNSKSQLNEHIINLKKKEITTYDEFYAYTSWLVCCCSNGF